MSTHYTLAGMRVEEMLYMIMAVPMPTAGSFDEAVALMERAVLPSMKAVAGRERKRKLVDIAVVSETVTVIAAEFQSRAEANETLMRLRSQRAGEKREVSLPAYGPVFRKALQQPQTRPVPRMVYGGVIRRDQP